MREREGGRWRDPEPGYFMLGIASKSHSQHKIVEDIAMIVTDPLKSLAE